MPRISVIVPAYNAASTLPRLLRSLQLQTCRDFEVVVVDDRSNDATSDVARTMAGDLDMRILAPADRSGVARARNLALQSCTSEWAAMIDADDWIHPERLECLLATAASRGGDWIADQQIWFDEHSGRPLRLLLDGGPVIERVDDFAERLFTTSGVHGRDRGGLATLKPMVRLQALHDHALWYDETLSWCEDLEWSLRCALAGLGMRWCPVPNYFYQVAHHGRHGDPASVMQRLHSVLAADVDRSSSPRLRAALARRKQDMETSILFATLRNRSGDAAAPQGAATSRARAVTAATLWYVRYRYRMATALRPQRQDLERFHAAAATLGADARAMPRGDPSP